jgi:NAD+ synthetase
MRVGLAQVDVLVGDLAGNVARCERAVRLAAADGADLVVLPELVIPGYPPRDLLLDPSFVAAVTAATVDLAQRLRGLPPTVAGTVATGGTATPGHPGLLNVAALLADGAVQAKVAKRLLPGYDVFFEPRWFSPGGPSPLLTVAGCRIGLVICEDLWDEGYPLHPPAELVAAGAELLISIAASPYRPGVLAERRRHARRAGVPVVAVNLVGGQDELIFDGRSFVVDGSGRVLAQLAAFAEEVRVVDLAAAPAAGDELEPEEELFRALTLGIADFARKNRLERAVLGLSGGVDSALVAALARAALGPGRVTALALPSRHTDPRSTTAAEELARTLGIAFEVLPIEPLHAAAEAVLGPRLAAGTAAENVQARLRALLLMAEVNAHGGMLLNTSNKTELALGYGTLYGDLAGALAPLADLTKPEVQAVAAWVDRARWPIPAFIRTRPPSAELSPGQVDPFDYAELAPRLEALVQANRSDPALLRSEHKRGQLGVALKLSAKAFGSGRMIPVTRR